MQGARAEVGIEEVMTTVGWMGLLFAGAALMAALAGHQEASALWIIAGILWRGGAR